jgi:glycine betaine/proline transport system ATP-binding protein
MLQNAPGSGPVTLGTPGRKTTDDRLEMTDAALTCTHLWKAFGRGTERGASLTALSDAERGVRGITVGVRDVSLSIRTGEVFVLMGLSGSGKSTLLRCLATLTPTSAGTLSIEGRAVDAMTEADLRHLRRDAMGMVFQDFALLPHLSVLDNVAFPLKINGVAKSERIARAQALLATVGLADRAGFFPAELSGGQKQRVGIARSLASDPRLWFLDEPFSALDPIIRYDLQTELLRLQAVLKKTIVFVTHDFDEAMRIGTRLAILRDGAIVQVGTPEEIVLSPADDYVRRFTSRVDLTAVLTVGRLAEPGLAGSGPPLAAATRLREAMPRLLSSDAAVPVVDAAGRITGSLSRAAVLNALAGRGTDA